MFRINLSQLSKELSLPTPSFDKERTALFSPAEDVAITFRELDKGFSLTTPLLLCPEPPREELFLLLMRANFLSEGTGGARIGYHEPSRHLTLSLSIPYELNYAPFRDLIEDLVNYVRFWRGEIANFEKKQR